MELILDMLNQGLGRNGNIPAWFYVVCFVISLVSAASAKRVIEKRKVRRAEKVNELYSHELRAHLYSEEGGEDIRHSASLKYVDGKYRLNLSVEESCAGREIAVVEEESIDEIAVFLRKETKFVLSDFRK